MDRAVLDAYGWTDVAVPPYCPLSDADKQALQAFEDEVIDRLYALNAERAREEERLGLDGKERQARTDADGKENRRRRRGARKAGAQKERSRPNRDWTNDQGKLFK